MNRRFVLPFALSALLVLSCTDSPLEVPPPEAPSQDLVGDLLAQTGLLRCEPMPYDSVTKVVGRRGGVIRVGGHRLRIPRGALREPVTITAVAPSGTNNVVRFEPHGLEFRRPARLTMTYANCSGPITLLPKRVAYTSDLLDILYYLPSVDNLQARRVTGKLDHFSGYAVAW